MVAGRRFGRKGGAEPERPRVRQEGEAGSTGRDDKFRHAGDELQTDETFDHEIVDRMGHAFYDRVFAPAIRAAVDRGEKYEQFRDSIRASWKPTKQPATR